MFFDEAGMEQMVMLSSEVREFISPEKVREFAENAGAFCYCRDHDAAVYVSNNLIGICAPQDGTYTVNLPSCRRWIPLFARDTGCFEGSSVTLELRQSETAGFRLEDL